MAKIPPESITGPNRGLSIKGVGYTREWRGKLIWQRWPVRQPTPRTPLEKETITTFSVASTATLYFDPFQLDFANAVARQTTLLPRDLLMMALYNRGTLIVQEDGRKLYSMAALQDVSDLLDTIGQVPGDMMYRGTTWWTRLPVGNAGDFLQLDVDQHPFWGPSGNDGGAGYMPWNTGSTRSSTETNAFSTVLSCFRIDAAIEVRALTAEMNPNVDESVAAIIGEIAGITGNQNLLSVHTAPTVAVPVADGVLQRRWVFDPPVQIPSGANFFYGFVNKTGPTNVSPRPFIDTNSGNPFPFLPRKGASFYRAANNAPAAGDLMQVLSTSNRAILANIEAKFL